eukprot:2630906-Prymnesium_polylepis.2
MRSKRSSNAAAIGGESAALQLHTKRRHETLASSAAEAAPSSELPSPPVGVNVRVRTASPRLKAVRRHAHAASAMSATTTCIDAQGGDSARSAGSIS